jgi:hypothetical protein
MGAELRREVHGWAWAARFDEVTAQGVAGRARQKDLVRAISIVAVRAVRMPALRPQAIRDRAARHGRSERAADRRSDAEPVSLRRRASAAQ